MSRIFELFAGEFVRLTLVKNHRQSIEHGGAIKTIESPMVVEGYLTEEDEDYFYLGTEISPVQVAVGKNQMSTMEIIDPNEMSEDIFKDFLSGNDSGDKKGDMN